MVTLGIFFPGIGERAYIKKNLQRDIDWQQTQWIYR
jgi:hypothetical protein